MSVPADVAGEQYTDAKYDAKHRQATRKIFRYLMPILLFAYFMAFVDRTNVGLAKERMEVDVGLSATAYGLGAGLFFITYALLEVPSNLMLHKIGARVWIARIAITWGLISSAMMFVSGPVSFYVLRMLLGAAEAGLFPGIMYLITVWFAQKDRAKAVGIVLLAAVAALMIANPIGGGLMLLDGAGGLHGWQWMFLIEGIPPVLIGIYILFRLPNGPRDARFLDEEEKAIVLARVAPPDDGSGESVGMILRTVSRQPFLLLIAAIYFINQIVTYGVVFFVPSIVESMGVDGSFVIGLVSAVAYIGSFVGAIVVPRINTRINRPAAIIVVLTVVLAVLTVPFLTIDNAVIQMILLVVMGFCITGVQPLYWSLAMGRVLGAQAAAGLALVNTIGLVGGFVGPYLFGISEGVTGSPLSGMAVVGVLSAVAVVIVLPLTRALRRHDAKTGAMLEV
ncbi:MFS transporter [Cumulibacter soli]|uniref:MFS transporter n=1 Tax=Cumulibacter soli TaxID=2546344 RepID=UPI001ABA2025|nr:MFS transporter [Cumulibacter soli]